MSSLGSSIIIVPVPDAIVAPSKFSRKILPVLSLGSSKSKRVNAPLSPLAEQVGLVGHCPNQRY